MAFSEVAQERTSSTLIERGLYVLRYVESTAHEPPQVFVRASFGSEAKVRLIGAPGASSDTLSRPGTAMVVLAEQQAGVQMTVQASGRSGALEATLRFEPLHETAAPQAIEAPSRDTFVRSQRASPVETAAGFQLLAHVSRRGDVTVSADRWVAGPDAPAPIEAIAVTIPTAGRIGVQYQVMTRGSAHWSDWIDAGSFAGTRGQYLALTGVRFRLTGPGAAEHMIAGSALFLGTAILEQSGENIEFRSASGQDPLVGLKLDIKATPVRAPVADRVVDHRRSEWSSPPVGERKSRVRVFRAGVEQR